MEGKEAKSAKIAEAQKRQREQQEKTLANVALSIKNALERTDKSSIFNIDITDMSEEELGKLRCQISVHARNGSQNPKTWLIIDIAPGRIDQPIEITNGEVETIKFGFDPASIRKVIAYGERYISGFQMTIYTIHRD